MMTTISGPAGQAGYRHHGYISTRSRNALAFDRCLRGPYSSDKSRVFDIVRANAWNLGDPVFIGDGDKPQEA
jgi:hypothetical protein